MRPPTPTCPYCGNKATHVKGSRVYPHRKDLKNLDFYWCANNHDPAYVGCHKGSLVPLGRLADSELRAAKIQAHNAFDPLWRSGQMTRGEAYGWLARKLEIDKSSCHIGMFSVEECKKVVRICNKEVLGE